MSSKFAILELQNYSDEGVQINTFMLADRVIRNNCNVTFQNGGLYGWTLEADEVFNGNLNLGGGTLDLNGYTLTVIGDFTQFGGTLHINGGRFDVKGHFKLQSSTGTASNGIFDMTNNNDRVIVGGDFLINTTASHSTLLTAGTLEIKGNFTQSSANATNYRATGTHKTLFTGSNYQEIRFANPGASNSCFNILEIKNTSSGGVALITDVFVMNTLVTTDTPVTGIISLASSAVLTDNIWHGDLRFYDNKTITADWTIGGSLYIDGGTFNMNAMRLFVSKNIILTGNLNVNGGSIFVSGDFRVQTESTAADRTKTYSQNNAYLQMTTIGSYIRVDGSFFTHSTRDHTGYLTAGIIEVKRYFYQIGNFNSFNATGTHTVILNGSLLQRVSFGSLQSSFNILEINKLLEIGYDFNRIPLWRELIEYAEDIEPPTAPTNLVSVRTTANSITLEWNESIDNFGVDGYDVYRDGIRIGYSMTNKYIDIGLKPDTEYIYYIVAYDLARNYSGRSNLLTTVTDVNFDAPSAPDNLRISNKTTDSVDLVWLSSKGVGNIEGYMIYRNDEYITTVRGLGYTDRNLAPGDYTYYIRAVDCCDNLSRASNIVLYDNMPPTSPVLTLVTSTLVSATLTWTAIDNIGIRGYYLYRNDVRIADIAVPQYTDTGLQASSSYIYYVLAYDEAGNISEKSNELIVSTMIDTVPPVITSIITSSANGYCSGNVAVTVTARDNVSINYITLQGSTDEETWTSIGTLYCSGRTTETVSFNVSLIGYPDGFLYLRAIAVDMSGNTSLTSNTFIRDIYVLNTLPASPKDILVSTSDNYIDVKWKAPDNEFISHFIVYRSIEGGNYQIVANNYRHLNYIDLSIELGVNYSYRVAAVDIAGNVGAFSDAVTGSIDSDNIAPEVLSVLPLEGTTIQRNQNISIACYDNYRLGSIKVECSIKNLDIWQNVYSQNLNTSHRVVSFNLDTSNLKSGEYTLKITLLDSSNNETVRYHDFKYVECMLSKPIVEAVSGAGLIELNWNLENDENLAGFNIYRKAPGTVDYTLIARVAGTNYTDTRVEAGKTYSYIIEAFDIYMNSIKSDDIIAIPGYKDTIPLADVGINRAAIEGKPIEFNGSNSTDDYKIVSYTWDFGDGNTSDSIVTTHTYLEEGTYTVKLTVTNENGKSSTSEKTVKVLDKNFFEAEIQVLDVKTGIPIKDTMIYCEIPDLDITEFKSDSNGIIRIPVKNGFYTFFFYKEGYLPTSKSFLIDPNTGRTTVHLEEKKLIDGNINIKRLELSDILSYEINIEDPANQYVYQYELVLDYGIDDEGKIRVDVVVNQFGEIINVDYAYRYTELFKPAPSKTSHVMFTIDTDSSKSTSTRNVQTQISTTKASDDRPPLIAILSITNEISWLKEFFDVSLTIVNNADEQFNIDNAFAELKLPRGVSLASTYKEDFDNALIRDLGSVKGGKTVTESWIIRGDTAGEYNIEAHFSGFLMPFGEEVNIVFKSDPPLKVWGGQALHLDIKHLIIEDTSVVTTFELTNVSDITIYNISMEVSKMIGGIESNISGITLSYSNGLTEYITWINGEKHVESFYPVTLSKEDIKKLDNSLKPKESVVGSYRVRVR
ncbi:MAG: PKD domain-containing protein [Oscillospiraceae bacterium]|nr:PKD domain-containing protein [Oscillospiraceae bacterium]